MIEYLGNARILLSLKMNSKTIAITRIKQCLAIALFGCAVASPCRADVYRFADFTRAADQASKVETFDFVPNEGWTGTPPEVISDEESLYLKFTVSWDASDDIGSFLCHFNSQNDGGGMRAGVGTAGSGFGLSLQNRDKDPDGDGPATTKPKIDAYDKRASNSVTFVLKIDQIKAHQKSIEDWWYADIARQDKAAIFLHINPNLNAPEASQPTQWAAWRSGNHEYRGMSFITDTAGVDLHFSDITLYTGEDTPFSMATVSSGGIAAESATAGLLVYEGFDYELGKLTGKDGGIGFSGGWTSPEANFVASVFDENGGSMDLGDVDLTWDNVVDNVVVSSPHRYLASTQTSNPGSTAARVLASDAGTLAGSDNILWMGVVFHYADRVISSGLNIGLTPRGSIIDRGRKLDTAGMDFIGVTNWAQPDQPFGDKPPITWNNKLNATIIHDHVPGMGYSGLHAQTLGTKDFSTSEDMLVVLKFTFGEADTVEAVFFTESETLSEAAFNNHPSRVSVTYEGGIDESRLNTVSYTQGRGGNAIDEIRIGNSFTDTFAGDTVDADYVVDADYERWAKGHPGLGNFASDDDSDGMTNNEERIFGVDPMDASSVNPFNKPFDSVSGTFSYTRRTQSLTGLTYKVMASTDQKHWIEDAKAIQTAGTPTDGVQNVTVKLSPEWLTKPQLAVRISVEDDGKNPVATD